MTQQVILDLKKELICQGEPPHHISCLCGLCAPALCSPSVSVGLGLAFEAVRSDADQAATTDFGCHLPSLRVCQPELFPATFEVSCSLAVPPHLPHLFFLW